MTRHFTCLTSRNSLTILIGLGVVLVLGFWLCSILKVRNNTQFEDEKGSRAPLPSRSGPLTAVTPEVRSPAVLLAAPLVQAKYEELTAEDKPIITEAGNVNTSILAALGAPKSTHENLVESVRAMRTKAISLLSDSIVVECRIGGDSVQLSGLSDSTIKNLSDQAVTEGSNDLSPDARASISNAVQYWLQKRFGQPLQLKVTRSPVYFNAMELNLHLEIGDGINSAVLEYRFNNDSIPGELAWLRLRD